jgi:hypothetical protein
MPKEYIDNTGAKVGEMTVISKYFRKQDETIAAFSQQIKAFTPEDKAELAAGAAKEMGWITVS